jgi:hypothetical protein
MAEKRIQRRGHGQRAKPARARMLFEVGRSASRDAA